MFVKDYLRSVKELASGVATLSAGFEPFGPVVLATVGVSVPQNPAPADRVGSSSALEVFHLSNRHTQRSLKGYGKKQNWSNGSRGQFE